MVNTKPAPVTFGNETETVNEEEMNEQELVFELRALLQSYEKLNQQYDQRIDTILVKKRNN